MGLRDGQDHKAREEQLRAVVIEFNKRDRERKDRFKLYGETYENKIDINGFGLNNTTWQKEKNIQVTEKEENDDNKFKR